MACAGVMLNERPFYEQKTENEYNTHAVLYVHTVVAEGGAISSLFFIILQLRDGFNG